MSSAFSFLATATLLLACAGFGGMILSAFSAQNVFETALERFATGLAIGFGFIGWLLFFPAIAGYLTPLVFWGIGITGVALLAIGYRRFGIRLKAPKLTGLEILLLAALALTLGMDFLEGISPPADADSLSYHFALPRQFAADHQVSFVPRAVSGAIPFLIHMTYTAAYGMGGELSLTLWTMVTGWVAAFLVYAATRQALSRAWALALAIAFLTTPAVLYGGGSGQVEIRCAIFALACTSLMLAGNREVSYKTLALAGVCAGFFVGAKYFGLIFAGAAGIVLICNRDGLRRGLVFGAAAVVIGCQWYFWNWFHTGDPVFPVLTGFLNFPDTLFWTREFDSYFTDFMARNEMPLQPTIGNWLLYPVYSIFNIVERLEGGRTGLGVLTVIVFPLALLALGRKEMRRPEYTIPLLIALIFYTVWFFGGGTQRTRHLLPVYPLLLMGLFPLAVAVARQAGLTRALAAGMTILVAIQLAGQTVFSVNYGRYVFSNETRASFLNRNVTGANITGWINTELPPEAKIGFMYRELAYLIDPPAFMMHPHIQAVVDVRPTTGDAAKFVSQASRQNLTHLILSDRWWLPERPGSEKTNLNPMIRGLIRSGCLKRLKAFDTQSIPSRTLKQLGDAERHFQFAVFSISYAQCPNIK